jgi:hypothetical protein
MSTEQMRIFAKGDKFGPSGSEEVNFYFESGIFGVSDNHRMAYPFFLRQGSKKATLIHLDAHADCEHFWQQAQDALAQIDASSNLDAFVHHRYYAPRACGNICPVSSANWITALFRTDPPTLSAARLICLPCLCCSQP